MVWRLRGQLRVRLEKNRRFLVSFRPPLFCSGVEENENHSLIRTPYERDHSHLSSQTDPFSTIYRWTRKELECWRLSEAGNKPSSHFSLLLLKLVLFTPNFRGNYSWGHIWALFAVIVRTRGKKSVGKIKWLEWIDPCSPTLENLRKYFHKRTFVRNECH